MDRQKHNTRCCPLTFTLVKPDKLKNYKRATSGAEVWVLTLYDLAKSDLDRYLIGLVPWPLIGQADTEMMSAGPGSTDQVPVEV